MSKTLFWYLLKDLLRVFIMAVGALAGIMSFGGLLRPLTENGLDMGQVGKLLTFMTPAMSAYSLPVAALFATTVVYGRFSADNELTAMRACGIGYLTWRGFSIALPALVLGLIVALISLLLLCFIVPVYSLKVEQVIYSNIAKVIASHIEREHEMDFKGSGGDVNVYAQQATLLEPDPLHPQEQSVRLMGPAIVKYEPHAPGVWSALVPREFWMASEAVVTISRVQGPGGPGGPEQAQLRVRLTNGIKFPRIFKDSAQASVADTTFGPIEIPSLIRENVKFMDISTLADLAADPGKSQKVQAVLQSIILRQQEDVFLEGICDGVKNGGGRYTIPGAVTADAKDYRIGAANAVARMAGGEVIVSVPGDANPRPLLLEEVYGGKATPAATAREMHIRAKPNNPNKTMAVSIELYDTVLLGAEGPNERASLLRSFDSPMPAEVLAMGDGKLDQFVHDTGLMKRLSPREAFDLNHEQLVARNAVHSELHGRVSFALSCLVLVMMGCALGVMFKSGNFLTAFAVSFMPALLCITLIVCGQQMATHVPFELTANIRDPLPTAKGFIWAGNALVLAAATVLTVRLQRR